MAAQDERGGPPEGPQQQPATPQSTQLEPTPTAGPAAPGGEAAPTDEIPTQVVTTGSSSRLPSKKVLLLVFLLLVLLAAGFGVLRLVLPRLSRPQEITLTYWGLWEDESIISPLITEYQEQNPGVKIQYKKQASQDYRERLQNSLSQGNGPDIFRFHNTWVPMFSSQLAPVPPEIMDAQTFSQTFYPVASSSLTLGANIVGIPLEFDGLGLFINEDIFAAGGKSPPSTWDELRRTALELTVRDEQGTITQSGVALGTASNVDHWQDILALMLLQNGADPAMPTGQLAEDALSFYTIFAKTDRVWDETLPPSTLAFAGGKLAMYFGPSWRAFEIRNTNPNLSFRIVAVPQLPKTGETQADLTWASFWAEGVWNKSPNQEAAWDFLQFLSTRESLQKLYQNAARIRLFGEPYSRVDMAGLVSDDPLVGAYIKQAPNARSWYLASRTFDGPTGINSRISKYFEDAINAVNQGEDPDRALQTAAAGVSQVLSQYGVSR